MNRYVLYSGDFGYVTNINSLGNMLSFEPSETPLLFNVSKVKYLKSYVAIIYAQTGVELDMLKADDNKIYNKEISEDTIKEFID